MDFERQRVKEDLWFVFKIVKHMVRCVWHSEYFKYAGLDRWWDVKFYTEWRKCTLMCSKARTWTYSKCLRRILSMVCLHDQEASMYALHCMSMAEYCEPLLERLNRRFSLTTTIKAAFNQYDAMAQICGEAELSFSVLLCHVRQSQWCEQICESRLKGILNSVTTNSLKHLLLNVRCGKRL